MQTQLSTVTRLFTDALYRIPDYQRGYAWSSRQLKDFWADIEQLHQDKSHYVGVLTLERVPESIYKNWADDSWIIESRKYQPYYVVDGQQRLTTIAILINCIIEAIPENEKIAFQSKNDLKRRYLFESKDEGLSKSYLFGYEKDNPSYEYLKTQVFNDESNCHSINEVTIYTKNLKDAKLFFKEKLKSIKIDELNFLFKKITQSLLFNTYEITEEVDVFVAFETMNNRGKALSRLELLKNRLIYLSTRMNTSNEGDLLKLRKLVNEAWKDVYHFLGKNETRPLNDDTFLDRHLYNYHAKHISKINFKNDIDGSLSGAASIRYILMNHGKGDFLLDQLFNIKRLNETKTDALPRLDVKLITQYALDMKSQAQFYFKASSPELAGAPPAEAKWLERLTRLQGFEPSHIVLFVISSEKDYQKRTEFWEVLERYIFIQSLISEHHSIHAMRMSNENETILFLSGKRNLDEYKQHLINSIINLLGKDFSEALSEWTKSASSYYGWRRIKYFLYEYECSLHTESKNDRIKLNWNEFSNERFEADYETVEHIYPQRAKDKYWTSRFELYSVKQRTQLRNSLGNLLALSRPKNASLGNKSFVDKLGDADNFVGYKSGCYSENEVALAESWDAQAIIDRGLKMLNFLEIRWKLVLGDRQAKIKSLGIDFPIQKMNL